MHDYARLQTKILLRRFAFQLSRAARATEPGTIHDLRVAIRRLSRCLRLFQQFYPGKSGKKIRKQLGELMDRAAAIRDRDIALELLSAAGVSPRVAIVARLAAERRKAEQSLRTELEHWKRRNFFRRWRAQLGLS